MAQVIPSNIIYLDNAASTPIDKKVFEEMLPFMKKMHPNLSDDQLKDLYDQMMGPSGACSNMMGNFNGNTQWYYGPVIFPAFFLPLNRRLVYLANGNVVEAAAAYLSPAEKLWSRWGR